MRDRRGPWLSGLIVALIGAVWMIGQVIAGGVVSMAGEVIDDAVPPAGVVSAH
jgi:hypothetical protein